MAVGTKDYEDGYAVYGDSHFCAVVDTEVMQDDMLGLPASSILANKEA